MFRDETVWIPLLPRQTAVFNHARIYVRPHICIFFLTGFIAAWSCLQIKPSSPIVQLTFHLRHWFFLLTSKCSHSCARLHLARLNLAPFSRSVPKISLQSCQLLSATLGLFEHTWCTQRAVSVPVNTNSSFLKSMLKSMTFNRNLHLSDSVSHIQMIVSSCLKLHHLPMNKQHMLCSVTETSNQIRVWCVLKS